MKNFKIKVQSYNSEKDEYQVEKVYIVQRVVRAELDTLVELLKNILTKFVDHNAVIGEIVREPDTWELMKTLAKNFNIVGQKEKGFDLDEISEDLEQICRIFFTQSMSDEGEITGGDGWKQSLLTELHHLNFPLYLQEIVEKKSQEKKEEDLVKENKS